MGLLTQRHHSLHTMTKSKGHLWKALRGPPFPDQQVQEPLLPCGCHPAELCTTVIAPLFTPLTHLPPVTVLPPSTLALDRHTPSSSHCTFALECLFFYYCTSHLLL